MPRPIDPFTSLEPQNQSHDVPELNMIRQSPEFEALELLKGPVGWLLSMQTRPVSQPDRQLVILLFSALKKCRAFVRLLFVRTYVYLSRLDLKNAQTR